jgi:hypothetical protein
LIVAIPIFVEIAIDTMEVFRSFLQNEKCFKNEKFEDTLCRIKIGVKRIFADTFCRMKSLQTLFID